MSSPRLQTSTFALFALSSSFLGFSLAASADDTPLGCPQGEVTAAAVAAWQQTAAGILKDGSLPANQVAAKIRECFPELPACMKRNLAYASRGDVAFTAADVTIDQSPQKRPPEELLSPTADGLEYVIPENVEQLAADHGWPAVRYKSRHAGGFDPGTPSLLMVYVPGDKVNPPVNYDRWLNFAIPADTDENALVPTPQVQLPTGADYASELTGGTSLPLIFTMVTLEKKVGDQPGQVFFQMFRRAGAGAGNPVFRPEPNAAVASCYSCHPNGLRAISPLGYNVRDGEAQLAEKEWLTVQVINDAMTDGAGNRGISWRDAEVDLSTGVRKPLLNPAANGPIVGAVKPLNGKSRSQEFIMGGIAADGAVLNGCYNLRPTVSVVDIFGRAPGRNNIYSLGPEPSIRWEKVRDSMNCATCHNNAARGAFNERTDWSQLDFKMIVDQSMPYGAHNNPLDLGDATTPVDDSLTGDERLALANCLKAEFQLERKELAKWLTEVSCQE